MGSFADDQYRFERKIAEAEKEYLGALKQEHGDSTLVVASLYSAVRAQTRDYTAFDVVTYLHSFDNADLKVSENLVQKYLNLQVAQENIQTQRQIQKCTFQVV